MTGLGGPCLLCGYLARSRDCCQSRGYWGDGNTPDHIEINHLDDFNKYRPALYPLNGGSAMTEEQVLDICAKRIAEAEKQRDKARRELSRGRAIVRELLYLFAPDVEAEEGEWDGDRYIGKTAKEKAYDRAARFAEKRK